MLNLPYPRTAAIQIAFYTGSKLVLLMAWFAAFCSLRADTFKIEIDYMVADDHSHEPSIAVITTVIQMFACQGHTLIIDKSDAIPHYNVLRRDPNDCESSLFYYDGSDDSFGSIKGRYADHSEDDGWHYCVFAHQYEAKGCKTTSSSGLGEMPGWNFVVTLGDFAGQTGTEFQQAATLAHEFGHNLGLTHCGQEDCGGLGNYTPIMPSIMSYRYSLVGVRTVLLAKGLIVPEANFKEIDFSHGRMCSLDENSLDETFGTGMRAVDWNCDGSFDVGVAHDLNGGKGGWCDSSGTKSVIHDTNEWGRIADPSRRAPVRSREVPCIGYDEWLAVVEELGLTDRERSRALSPEPCLEGENVYLGPFNLFSNGSCRFPAVSVQVAHDDAPPNSTFFLLPGTFSDTALYGTVVLSKPGTWFCNVGTAVIE